MLSEILGRIFKDEAVCFVMITREEALGLLKRENVPEHIVRHCFLVNRIANYLADELVEMGVNADIDLVDVASLLHDVGRIKGTTNHQDIGADMLDELEEHDVAKVVRIHGVKKFDKALSIEEKIVNYADKRTKYDEIYSLDDKLDDGIERYPLEFKEIIERVRPKLKKFEDEVFGIIGEDKRGLESLKK